MGSHRGKDESAPPVEQRHRRRQKEKVRKEEKEKVGGKPNSDGAKRRVRWGAAAARVEARVLPREARNVRTVTHGACEKPQR